MGAARLESTGGARYFLSLIDDIPKRFGIHILKTKDEALTVFRVWKLKVENQTGFKVKNLRTDNSLEFVSEKFNARRKELSDIEQSEALHNRMD